MGLAAPAGGLPPLDVADIGCGEGYLTLETAQWARTVVGIDRSTDAADVPAYLDELPARDHNFSASRQGLQR